MTFSHCSSRLLPVVFLVFVPSIVSAQEQNSNQQHHDSSAKQDPLKRPLGEDRQKTAAQERESRHYRDWVRDVQVIITDEELAAFKKLGTDAERDNFIELFWKHRDPTPDTDENEYKEEFYRRKAYANEHFSAGIAGERTDRGRIYILHGPPDSIESHPMGGPYLRSAEEGGGTTETYPFEVWRYRHVDGIGEELTIEFVDACGCGEYRRTLNRSDKDVLKNIPNAGPTDMEAMGLATKADRLRDPEGVGQSLFGQNNGAKFFERLEQDAALERPPAPRMMETGVSHIIRYKLLPFDVRVDFVRAPLNTVLVPITVQVPNREITFVSKEGMQRGVLNIFGRLTSLTGKVEQSFEDTLRLDVPQDALEKITNTVSLYWKALPMRPGLYRLDIVMKDVNGDKLGTFGGPVRVPGYSEERLSSSSLILADSVEPVASREVGGGNFVIGASKVRPRMASDGKIVSFARDHQMYAWMQVYNLQLDAKTGRPSLTVEYEVVNIATQQVAMDTFETVDRMSDSGGQITLQKRLALHGLPPGRYQLSIKVSDLVSRQSISPAAGFAIE